MKKRLRSKKLLACLCSILLIFSLVVPVSAAEGDEVLIDTSALDEFVENYEETEETAASSDLGITATAAVLMEAETGTVLYEKNPDQALSPASITKIMTLILIFDALESGQIKLEEEVTTSAHARSMGGSQVFLEE